MEKPDTKEAQSDTSSVITMKEYASSEYPASEPPPAYMKPKSTALQIARLAAFTIIASAIILGGFILAASWIQANAARNLDLTLNQELLEDLQPTYEHLIANEALSSDLDNNAQENTNKNNEKKVEEQKETKEQEEQQILQNKEQIPMELDAIANILMQKNMKGKVNCIVERRKNEELVDHAPRSLNLPFGLNITTPPRLQHLTGEQMIVVCKDDEGEEKAEEKEQEQPQPVVFPLPSNLLNQIQQVPQIIPLSQLLNQLPVQQPQQQQQMLYHQPQVMYQPQPHQQQQQQPPQQPPMFYPQQPQQPVYYPYQPQPMSYQQPTPQEVDYHIDLPQRMVPLKDVRTNANSLPLNHIMANPVPINPMAVNDVPMMQMPITHLPMRNEPQDMKTSEPREHMNDMPVHHLVPPQQQEVQTEDFSHNEEQEMFRPAFRRPMVQRPYPFPPRFTRPRPNFVEIREPRVLNLPQQPPRDRMPFPMSLTEVTANRIPEDNEFPEYPPVQGRMPPMDENREQFRPNRMEDFRPLPIRGNPVPIMGEKIKIIKMIPFNMESRRPFPTGGRIRFPEMNDNEGGNQNRVPVITQITKIIPIRIEKEEPKMSRIPISSAEAQNLEVKSIEEIDNKVEKLPENPFPIPINAILDMIFRGIRPIMNQRGPIEVKIERLDKQPIDEKPVVLEKVEPVEIVENPQTQTSVDMPAPNDLLLDDLEGRMEKEPEDKESSEEKEDKSESEEENAETVEIREDVQWQKFLPNGEGRGARAFPLPPQNSGMDVFDIPMSTGFKVENPADKPNDRQGRMMNFPVQVEGEVNLEAKARSMKPIQIPTGLHRETFTVEDNRSIRLLPVQDNMNVMNDKPVSVPPPVSMDNDEDRPHFVQPRSV